MKYSGLDWIVSDQNDFQVVWKKIISASIIEEWIKLLRGIEVINWREKKAFSGWWLQLTQRRAIMPPFRLTFLKICKLGWQNQIEKINWRMKNGGTSPPRTVVRYLPRGKLYYKSWKVVKIRSNCKWSEWFSSSLNRLESRWNI